MASVQELIMAAQAKQQKSPLSMLAELVNSGAGGYKAGTDIAKVQSETDLRRANIAKTLLEAKQLQDEMDAQAELRRLWQEKLATTAEQNLRASQAATAKPPAPTTPAKKFTEEWNQDAKGNISRSIKEVTPPAEPPKAPPGFRYTADGGNLEPIPGGPADIKAQADKAKADLTLANQEEKAKNVLDTIDEAMPLVDEWSTGYGSYLKNLPKTKANLLDAKINTITSNLGIDQLAEMKAQSRTGASGFGALNEKELQLLLTSVTNLKQTQDPAVVKQNLEKIRTHYNNWLELQKGNDPYRKSGGAGAGSDTTAKPTMRWNPQTKKVEPL